MEESIQKNRKDYCGNCHYPIKNEKYCSKCGQKHTDGRISIREFFSVVFLTVFNFESKFFRTNTDIFVPGKLTIQWFKGRHKPYFHPIRLFIVSALLLIGALSLFIVKKQSVLTGSNKKVQQEIYRKEFIKEIENFAVLYLRDKNSKTVLDSLNLTMKKGKIDSGKKTLIYYAKKFDLPDINKKSIKEIIAIYEKELGSERTDSIINVVKSKRRLTQDSVHLINIITDDSNQKISNEDFINLSADEITKKYQIDGFFNRLHFRQRIRLQKGGENIIPFILGNSLWIALLMMPFLAIILKILYVRHDYFYVEHLIFLFHMHSFAFLLFTVICIFLKFVYFHPLIVFLGFFLLFIYLYKSLRSVYQQVRWKTLSKLLFANIIYLCLFFSFALLGSIVSIFLF